MVKKVRERWEALEIYTSKVQLSTRDIERLGHFKWRYIIPHILTCNASESLVLWTLPRPLILIVDSWMWKCLSLCWKAPGELPLLETAELVGNRFQRSDVTL